MPATSRRAERLRRRSLERSRRLALEVDDQRSLPVSSTWPRWRSPWTRMRWPPMRWLSSAPQAAVHGAVTGEDHLRVVGGAGGRLVGDASEQPQVVARQRADRLVERALVGRVNGSGANAGSRVSDASAACICPMRSPEQAAPGRGRADGPVGLGGGSSVERPSSPAAVRGPTGGGGPSARAPRGSRRASPSVSSEVALVGDELPGPSRPRSVEPSAACVLDRAADRRHAPKPRAVRKRAISRSGLARPRRAGRA